MKKRIRFRPIAYVGMAFIGFAIFGDDILKIDNALMKVGNAISGLIGIALMIKGKEIYESLD